LIIAKIELVNQLQVRPMKIEFWFDYLCPMSYQTHQNLIHTLKQNQQTDVELLYRSYELIPLYENQGDQSLYDVLEKHHLFSRDEVLQYTKHININIGEIKPVSTIDAHRLSHLAKRSNLASEFNQAVFEAYYVDQKDISQHHVLKSIAQKVGLSSLDVDDVLTSDKFHIAVQMNRENALLKGIHQIPHMRINGRIKLLGYQTPYDIITGLNMAKIQYRENEHCIDGNCDRKKTH
jgi:predicted DsbA family dithiol-disulfide isomerase